MGHNPGSGSSKRSKGPKRNKARAQTRRRAIKGRKAAPAILEISNKRFIAAISRVLTDIVERQITAEEAKKVKDARGARLSRIKAETEPEVTT